MSVTQQDILLKDCLIAKQKAMKDNISGGHPYVWELRLSKEDFFTLENAINNSITSHGGTHQHLLSEEYAVVVVMYLAEWYKRFYKGADTMDENKILALNTEELKQLYELAHIDKNTFVYNASKNPDKTSYRWQESLQVLGGLAVQAELKRDKDDNLLSQLCKIFHGEEIDLDNLKDRNRAVAFQESIARQHSLYEYLKCILEKDSKGNRNLPFAKSDTKDEETMIPQLIKRIEVADEIAKKHKFDFEWLITYSGNRNQMVRHLRVKLKPEEIGGGKKQYIGYDRLRRPEWGIETPENIGRLRFYLRFKNGGHYVQKEEKDDEPLFKYDNTGSENTGFLSVNKQDENVFINVPVERFDKVEIVVKYDNTYRIVQELLVNDYLQVYQISGQTSKFTDRKNAQAATSVIFSSAYHLADEYKDLPVMYAHFRNGEKCSEDYCWCPINDKVVLVDYDGNEVLPPFFNRNGMYQVVTRQYLKTIKYRDNLYVLYKYIDTDDDEDEMQEDSIPVLFGRSGLEVRHFSSALSKDSEPVMEYDLEWMKDSHYIDWKKEEPKQGEVRLRVTVKGLMFKLKVYYVPFSPESESQQPIWRDFNNMRICTSLEGVEDIQDDFNKSIDIVEPDTKQLEIGTDEAKILVDVYRPIILRELSQKKSGDSVNHVVRYYDKDEQIHIPLINCDQFSIRDFSEVGVRHYNVSNSNSVYYSFPTFNTQGIDGTSFLIEENASKLTQDIPLDYLKIYITDANNAPSNLYAWNYKDEPKKVDSADELSEEGIVFQSMKDCDSPLYYVMPTIRKGKGGWGGKKAMLVVDPLYCFETVAEHKVYFFMFNPLIKTVSTNSQIKDILIPLLKKRSYKLTGDDLDNLYRFATHFHFDWMLLPRDTWKAEIDKAAESDEEKDLITDAIISFFESTPKCTDSQERVCLKDFLNSYWIFDEYPKIDQVAEIALKLIKGESTALGKINSLKDFLKIYDECRFKFIEMNKVICKD